ncbi:MAG TPA: AarF/UbiB family protein [Chloroflexota bacterium]
MWSAPRRLVGGPRGFRELLERLGPTFIKVGQYLALRRDLVSPEFADELMLLQDRAPSFAWAQAEAILTADLGHPPSALFDTIQTRPIAAGSLAQTHLATLPGGTRVAVKIQRPDVREQVLRDLRRARTVARVLDMSGATLIADPRQIVAELERWLLQELDLRRELANLTRLQNLMRSQPRIARAPTPFPDLCGTRVLTAEYLAGVPVSELLAALRSDAPDQRARVERLSVDRDRLASHLITSTLTQVFRYEFFHADIHPGNLIALEDDVIGYVDFGLCAELDEGVRERQLRYLAASYSGQPEQVYRALLDILIVSDETDIDGFHRDFVAETREWRSHAAEHSNGVASLDGNGRNGNGNRRRSSIANYLVGIMRAAQRNRVQVPADLLAMYRTLTTADSIAHQLGSSADLTSVGRPFFERLRMEAAVGALDREQLQGTLLSLTELLRNSPGQLQQILSDLSEGTLTLNVSSAEAPSVARARDRRARLVVVAVLTVSIAVLISAPDLAVTGWIVIRWLLAVVLVGMYAWIAWQWRRLG